MSSQKHATRYEEFLLRKERCQNEVKRLTERQENEDHSCSRQELSMALSSALATGADRGLPLAMLKESDEAHAALWNETLLENDKRIGRLLPLAVAHLDDNHSKMPQSAMRLVEVTSVQGDRSFVDSFFEEFPECLRPTEECDDSDSEDENDIVPDVHAVATAKEPCNAPEPTSNDGIVSVYDAPDPVKASVPSNNNTVRHNPYNQTSNQTNFSAPSRNPYLNPPTHRREPQAAATWEDVRQQNPFQTAREYAQIAEEEPPPPPAAAARPANAIRGRNIPESLKRKFQPPKRNVDGKNSRQEDCPSRSTKKGNILSNGGGSLTRTSRSEDEKKDDDELPEALKGLDKELIEKIENEIMASGDTITFDDIAGLADAKQTVQELVCWPMKRPDLFTGLRRGPNGLLLFGPPGTGKTLIGKAIAYESGATFFSISSSSLTSKWIGEGEKLVRTLFAVAGYREPAVVFIDEIDSLLTQRKADENEASRRIKTEFLVQLDGTGSSGQGRVLCIGATNRPQELDDAARRRFVKRLYIPLPATPDRETLLRTLLGKNRHSLSEGDLVKLSEETDGFSGADLKALCTDAAMGPIRQLGSHALEVDPKDVPPISYKHFRRALRATAPSVAPEDLEMYVKWNQTYGSTRASQLDDESDEEG